MLSILLNILWHTISLTLMIIVEHTTQRNFEETSGKKCYIVGISHLNFVSQYAIVGLRYYINVGMSYEHWFLHFAVGTFDYPADSAIDLSDVYISLACL